MSRTDSSSLCEWKSTEPPHRLVGDLGEQLPQLGSSLPGGWIDDAEQLVGDEEPRTHSPSTGTEPPQPRADELASKGSYRVRRATGERIKVRLAGGVDVALAEARLKDRRTVLVTAHPEGRSLGGTRSAPR